MIFPLWFPLRTQVDNVILTPVLQKGSVTATKLKEKFPQQNFAHLHVEINVAFQETVTVSFQS